MKQTRGHELIMKKNEYERTGKQIRIPEDELISIVLDALDHYMTLHPRERRNYPDPRKDPVVTRIASGRTIEVPQRLVDQALKIHQACGRIGSVERMESVGNGESNLSHTRLANRDRYSQVDPFIMNNDLRGTDMVGRDGEVASDSTFDDYPGEYQEFNKSMAKNVSRDKMASDLDDMSDPYGSNLHSRSDGYTDTIRSGVGSFKYGQTPGSGLGENGDYMNQVDGMESDISPDGDSASVYAHLEDPDDNRGGGYRSSGQQNEFMMRPDIGPQDYSTDPDYGCRTCGYDESYGSSPYDSDMRPTENLGDDSNSDLYRNDSEPGYLGGMMDRDDVEEDGYQILDENVVSGKGMIRDHRGDDDYSYNYLLWIMLIVLCVFFFKTNYGK